MCSNALHCDFLAGMMLKSCNWHRNSDLMWSKNTFWTTRVYTATWLTLCYGWRVGIVHSIFIVTATAAPVVTLPYLKLVYTVASYIILPLIRPSSGPNRLLKHTKHSFSLQKRRYGALDIQPKCVQKLLRKFITFWMVFVRLLASILHPTITKKCIQNRIENWLIFLLIFASLLASFWQAKCFKIGLKIN